MKNRLTIIASLLCFGVGIAALWLGRLELAKAPLLMVFISFWLLMGLLFALHADTTGNLQVIVQNVPVLRGFFINDKKTLSSVDIPVAHLSEPEGGTPHDPT
jgi:hypothetical protein